MGLISNALTHKVFFRNPSIKHKIMELNLLSTAESMMLSEH